MPFQNNIEFNQYMNPAAEKLQSNPNIKLINNQRTMQIGGKASKPPMYMGQQDIRKQ